ncbi:hypothetical protein [Clostridium sp. DJ247]|uniref:hypothetical protein n=1 Tax=Clostridium sp. DJ247 TaxID=2726188 RepID=UPI0016278AAF|nr:hypothetical protein [Clostridium sp. DJ247]MBC2579153.1 hypothetical protein [Clostridium sp. DJ247]
MKKFLLIIALLLTLFTMPVYAHTENPHEQTQPQVNTTKTVNPDTNKESTTNHEENVVNNHIPAKPKKDYSMFIPYVMTANVLVICLAGMVIYSERKKHFKAKEN